MSATCGNTNGMVAVVRDCTSAFSSRIDAQLFSRAVIAFMAWDASAHSLGSVTITASGRKSHVPIHLTPVGGRDDQHGDGAIVDLG